MGRMGLYVVIADERCARFKCCRCGAPSGATGWLVGKMSAITWIRSSGGPCGGHWLRFDVLI